MRDASKRVAKSLFLIAPKLRAFKSIRFFRISHLDTRINDQIWDASGEEPVVDCSQTPRIQGYKIFSYLSSRYSYQ